MNKRYAIMFDLRENNGTVIFLEDEYERIALYDDLREAMDVANKHPLYTSFPGVILDLDNYELFDA